VQTQNDDCLAVLLEITAVYVTLILLLSLSDELILEKCFSSFSSLTNNRFSLVRFDSSLLLLSRYFSTLQSYY